MEEKIEGKKEEKKKNRGKSWGAPNLDTFASEYVKMGNSNTVLEKHQKWLKSHIIWNMNLNYKTLAGIWTLAVTKLPDRSLSKKTGFSGSEVTWALTKIESQWLRPALLHSTR